MDYITKNNILTDFQKIKYFNKEKYLKLYNDIKEISNNEEFKNNVFLMIMDYATTKSKNKEFWKKWFQKNPKIESIFEIKRSYLISGGVVNRIITYLIKFFYIQ